MKKLLILATLALSTAAFGDMKIATIDMMKLVRNHPNYQTNKNLLTTTERDYQKKLDVIKAELEAIQSEGKKLGDEYRNPMLSATAKAKLEGEMSAIQTRFLNTQQKLRAEVMRNQQELTELETRLLKAQAEDIRERVAKFAEKNSYDFVLDVSAAIFAKKSYDVTKEILKDMGVDLNSVKEPGQDESK